MHLHTCTGCKFKGGCEHEVKLRTLLKGNGIRSVKFSCSKRESIFKPGMPAIFTTYTDDPNGEGSEMVSYEGVVIQQKGSKVIGFIKPNSPDVCGDSPFEAKGNGYVKMPLTRVEPDLNRKPIEIKVCRYCASIPSIDGKCEGRAGWTPSGCLLAERAP